MATEQTAKSMQNKKTQKQKTKTNKTSYASTITETMS